jgi:hypothetical protein
MKKITFYNYLICVIINIIDSDQWETVGLSSHMFMLSQTSNDMNKAVFNIIHKPRYAWIKIQLSRLYNVAQRLTLSRIKIINENNNLNSNIFQTLPYLTSIIKLDMSELITNNTNIDIIAFCRGLGQYCKSLQILHLSILFKEAFCIDEKGGSCWLSLFPKLRILDLSNMEISTTIAHNIYNATCNLTNLVELNLTNNEIDNIFKFLNDEPSLNINTLILDDNILGSINRHNYYSDSDSESDEVLEYNVEGLWELFNNISLQSLSLRRASFIDEEGLAIRDYLKTNTTLTYLDIRDNFQNNIRKNIEDSWNENPNRDPNKLKI